MCRNNFVSCDTVEIGANCCRLCLRKESLRERPSKKFFVVVMKSFSRCINSLLCLRPAFLSFVVYASASNTKKRWLKLILFTKQTATCESFIKGTPTSPHSRHQLINKQKSPSSQNLSTKKNVDFLVKFFFLFAYLRPWGVWLLTSRDLITAFHLTQPIDRHSYEIDFLIRTAASPAASPSREFRRGIGLDSNVLITFATHQRQCKTGGWRIESRLAPLTMEPQSICPFHGS